MLFSLQSRPVKRRKGEMEAKRDKQDEESRAEGIFSGEFLSRMQYYLISKDQLWEISNLVQHIFRTLIELNGDVIGCKRHT